MIVRCLVDVRKVQGCGFALVFTLGRGHCQTFIPQVCREAQDFTNVHKACESQWNERGPMKVALCVNFDNTLCDQSVTLILNTSDASETN